MKRKLMSLLLVFVMILSFGVVSVEASADISVIVDEQYVQFDVAPQIIGGRTMVPLRAIFEALGATVEWDDATKTIVAYNEISVVKCTIGSNIMYVNNQERSIDVSPMIVDSRTLVPARFVAEGFNCSVEWFADTKTVKITSTPVDYTKVEQDTSYTVPVATQTPVIVESNVGTRANPYSAAAGAVIPYQRWSFYETQYISVTCTNVIRGEQANQLANAENMFNEKPTSTQEWIFMEFNLNYVSSEGGADDILEGSDIIYDDTFFTTSGSAIPTHDLATLGDTYDGYGVFDVDLYPGSSSKVVIGLLIDKNIGDILLRVPKDAGDSNTWIKCTEGVQSSVVNSGSNAVITPSEYYNYSGTTVPSYTSVVGRQLKDTYFGENGVTIYIYDYDMDEFTNYVTTLLLHGWTEYDEYADDSKLTYYLVKDGDMVGVSFAAQYLEVWVSLA